MPISFPRLTASRNDVIKNHEITETYNSKFSCSDLHEAGCRDDALLTAAPTYAWAELLKVYTGLVEELVFDCILPQDLDTADTSLPFSLVCSSDAWNHNAVTLGSAVHQFSGHLVRCQDQQRKETIGTAEKADGGKQDQRHLSTLLDLRHLSESSRDRGLLGKALHDLPDYEIAVSIEQRANSNGLLLLAINGRGDVINEEAAQLLLAQYDLMLGTLIQCPGKSLRDIFTLFSAPLLSISNPQTIASVPLPGLHSQFQDNAKAKPEDIALEFWTAERSGSLRPSTTWTYAELNHRADLVATELESYIGSIAGCIVPICMDRCPEIYVTILGILKAGGAWCPIDPYFPPQRRHDLIARTDAKALVLNSRSPQDGIPEGVIAFELSRIDWTSRGSFPSRETNTDSLAYLIWTSGTTGAPKGVPISHQSATVSMKALQACIPTDVEHNHIRCLQFSQFTFDVFVQDLFYTWGSGGTLISADRDTMLGSFPDLATESRATHAHLTPAFAASVLRKQCPTLEVVTMIGEKLTQNVADDWSDDCRLYNTYGPAEAAVVATLRLVPHGDAVQSANIGVPMPSVSAFVIRDGEVVMKNGIGELALGGLQLSEGYWKDSERTKERFVWNDCLQTILYMTGDIVRQLYDGTFEYLGRTDDLIKIQGIRVELSEIAFSLRSCHSDVQQVEVFFLSRPDRPSKVLVAFLATPAFSDSNRGIIIDDHAIEVARKALEVAKAQLPDYMIPSIFLVVANIPRTTSAKVDRLAMEYLYAQLDLGAWEEKVGLTVGNDVIAAALDPYEVMIVELISNITGTSREAMSRQSTLPSIGVDSITATRLTAEFNSLRIQDYTVSVTDIVRCSTLDDLFQSSRKGNSKTTQKIFDPLAFHRDIIRFLDPNLAQHAEVILPALPLQESLLSETFQDPSAYWSNKLFELDTEIDLKRLEKAWMNVAQSTDALRITFHHVADFTIQLQVKTSFLQLVRAETRIDWTKISSSEDTFESRANDRAREIAEDRQARKFNEPLWAVTIFSMPSRTIMMLSIHHAIRDEPSLGIIMKDVAHAYLENTARLIQQRRQLRDAVSLLYIDDFDQSKRHEHFWSNSLSGFNDKDESKAWPELKLADVGRMRGTIKYCWDAQISYKSLRVKSANIGAASLASVLRVVWGCVLLEYLETDKVIYGETWSARSEAPELLDLVAPLVLVLPVPFQAHGTWREALQSTTNFQQRSRAYHGVHPRSIRKMMNRVEGEALYPAILNFVPPSAKPISNDTSSLWREVEDVVELSFEHTVALNATVSNDDILRFEMTALKRCIDKEHLHILGKQINALLEIILDNPDCQRSQLFNQIPRNLLSIEPLEEKPIINHAWSESPTEWVDHNAVTHPSWIAAEVVSSFHEDGVNSRCWSYGELYKAYRNVARFLSEAGYRQRMIGVCLERCLDVYALILGIMWTENTYLPIADDLPKERKMFLLKDSDAAMLFTSQSLSCDFSTACHTVLVEDLDYSKTVSESWSFSRSPIDGAYLLYTSGSTGSPKGVLVSRGNLTSFIEAFSLFIGLHMDMISFQGKGKWLGMASYAFDVHLLEMFFAWRHGMATVTAARSMLLDNLELALQQFRVTHASFVPSLVDNAGLDPARLPDLRYMSLGGEKISKRAIDTWSRSHIVFANAYGPTEATIGCCFRRVEPTNNVRNIGYPLPYTVAHVLRPGTTEYVLRGISGELCLTGDLVATGYLNRPEAKGFVDDSHGQRMYRTGDQVRLMSDGSLEFLGRKDDQTKIRGQRIELGEVSEAVRSTTRRILDVDLVEVASLVIQHSALTRPQLISFISIQEGSRDMADKNSVPISFPKTEAVEKIRTHCRHTLPSFMVPDHLIRLGSLPIVPSSRKVDMKRLEALFKSISLKDLMSSSNLVSTSVTILDRTEILVRRVVSAVLELGDVRVDADRNLFQFGLDSLNVINLTIKLQKEGLSCTVSKLLRNPTIRAISEGVTQRKQIKESTDSLSQTTDLERRFRGQGSGSVHDVNIAAIRPCLPLQETLVASSLGNEGEALYINHVLLEISPDVDHQRLTKAWAKTAVDNEILHTCFREFENHFIQLVLKVAPLSCDYMSTDAADDRILDLRQRQSDIAFDIIANIETQPPIRLTLASRQWPGDKELLLVSLHHAIYDAESFSMLLDEVYTNYQEMESVVTRTPITALINHIESQSQSYARKFWTRYLAGYSPSLKPQSIAKRQSSSMTKELVTSLADLERFAISINCTLPSIMQALVGIALAEKAQTQDVVFGTILSGRTVPVDNSHTILAPCITTIPQRVQIDCASNLRSVISSAQKGFVESIEHQHTALRDIHRWVQATTPLFDTLFTYTKRAGKASWSHLWSEVESSMSSEFRLAVEIVADQVMNRVTIRWDFLTASETIESVTSLAHRLQDLLLLLMQGPDVTLSFPLAEKSEQHLLGTFDGYEWSGNEILIRDIISSVVGLDARSISRNTAFFALGLDSIVAIQFAKRLRQHGLQCSSADVMRYSCIAKLGQHIASRNVSALPTDSGAIQHLHVAEACQDSLTVKFIKSYPCTPLQSSMLTQTLGSDTNLYTHHYAIRFPKEESRSRLRKAWEDVVYATEILRTSFQFSQESHAWSGLIHEQPVLVWIEHDASMSTQQLVSDIRGGMLFRGDIDFAKSPPWQVDVVRDVFILSLHHSLYDGESIRLLFQDLWASWKGSPLPKRPVFSLAAGEIDRIKGEAVGYWASKLGNFGGIPSGSVPGPTKEARARLNMSPVALLEGCKKIGVTVQSVALVAFGKTIALLSRREHITFGHVISGRSLPTIMNTDDIVGPLFNTVPVRMDLSKPSITNKDVLQDIQEMTGESQIYQHASLGKVQQAWREKIDNPEAVLLDSLFVFQRYATRKDDQAWESVALDGNGAPTEYATNFECEHTDIGINVCVNSSSIKDLGFLIRTFESTLIDILGFPDKPANHFFSDPTPLGMSLLDQSPGPDLPRRLEIDVGSDTLETVRRLLVKVSGTSIEDVTNGTSIFALGLDSISAIQIATEARKEGVELSVANVLQGRTVKGISQRLEQSQNKRLANNGQTKRTVTGHSHEPASDPLTLQVSNDAKSKVLALAGLRVDHVEEILPCLAGQYFHLLTWLKSGRTRGEGTFTYRCKDRLDPNRLLKAWRTLRESHSILRTVFISISTIEVMQAVLRPEAVKSDAFQYIDYWPSTMDTFGMVVKQIAACRFDFFSPPVKLYLARCTAGFDYVVLKLHHALYDAWTIGEIVNGLGALYEGKVLSPIPPSISMMRNIHCLAVAQSPQDYWRKALTDCQATMLATAIQPVLAVDEKQSRPRTSCFFLEKLMSDLHHLESRCQRSDTSLPRVILLAFSRSLAELTAVKSPTFGLYHTGRSSHMEALTKSGLPCMNMMPLMVREPLTRGIRSSVEDLGISLAAHVPFEQSKLSDIFNWIGWGQRPLFNTFVNILWGRENVDTRHEEDKTQDKTQALFSPWEAGAFEYLTPNLRLPGRTGVDGLNTSFLADGNFNLDVLRCSSEDELRLSVRCDPEVLSEEEAKVFLEQIGMEIRMCVEEGAEE